MAKKTELTRIIQDDDGAVYISIEDLINHFIKTRDQQQEIVKEEVTLQRFTIMLESTQENYLRKLEKDE